MRGLGQLSPQILAGGRLPASGGPPHRILLGVRVGDNKNCSLFAEPAEKWVHVFNPTCFLLMQVLIELRSSRSKTFVPQQVYPSIHWVSTHVVSKQAVVVVQLTLFKSSHSISKISP